MKNQAALRVLQVALSLSPGGTERLVIDIVRRLRTEGVESVVCCLDDEGAWAAEVSAMSVPVIALRRKPGFRPGVAGSIARLIWEHGIQVVHCHHYSSFVYGQLGALLKPGVRVVFTEHGRLSDAPPSTKRQRINPWFGRLPASVFAVSEDLRRHMIEEGFPASRVRVLHNGIDAGPEVTPEARRRAREVLGLAEDALVVGTIARLDPVKDLPTLVAGFSELIARVPSAVLVIVGDGPARGELEAEIGRRGIAGRVVLTGHRQDARALLAGIDLYVNSSIHEGVSLTILEAMAAAIPVIATDVGGNPEVVNEATGILVPARSPGAIAAALVELSGDQGRRGHMSVAARRRVETEFSLQRMVAQYAASYR